MTLPRADWGLSSTRLLHRPRSVVITRQAVAETASASYGWPLHVIDDTNDDPPIEQPEALLRLLRFALATP